jgi:hypothetical protein
MTGGKNVDVRKADIEDKTAGIHQSIQGTAAIKYRNALLSCGAPPHAEAYSKPIPQG